MTAFRTALIGAAASAALLATASAGYAQTQPDRQGRLIAVPPGAVVLVLPAGSVPAAALAGAPVDAALPFPDMPSPAAMIRQMDQMMADMQRSVASPAWADPSRAIGAAMQDMPQAGGRVSGVVVTSFSNGHGTCTQRVTYSGNGAAPVVQVSSTGNACAAAGVPAASPEVTTPSGTAPSPAAPHLIQVQNKSRVPAPLTYAQAGD
jgi:hypothetical protein